MENLAHIYTSIWNSLFQNQKMKFLLLLIATVFADTCNSNNGQFACSGNEINMTVSGNCEYCRSKIVVNPNKYVLSKKENIRQRW